MLGIAPESPASGAPHQDRKIAIFFSRKDTACPEDALCATCSLETARKGGG